MDMTVSVPVGDLAGQPSMVQAFEALFVAEYPKVVGVANRVLVDRAEAEDVAQEVFLDFHRRHSPTAPYAAAWLHRAAWHTALNRIRGRRRRERREELDAAGDRGGGRAADPPRIAERNHDPGALPPPTRQPPAPGGRGPAPAPSGPSPA